MMTTAAYETSASEAALTSITPVPDSHLTIVGNDIRVPDGMNNICGAAALINSAVATLRAELVAPSLRATINFDISPINNGLVFGSLPRLVRNWASPLPLVVNEPLDLQIQNGAAVMNRGLVWFCDGPPKPTTGKVYTVRATTSIALVTATWVNGPLTFGQTLPAGKYQIVGMRIWSANGVCARVFPVGAFWRPGVPMVNAEDNNEWLEFRYGGLGVWGEFLNTTPPTFDMLGITDTAQVVYLDLIKSA